MWCPQTPSHGCNIKRSFCAFCLAAICGTSDSLPGQQAFSLQGFHHGALFLAKPTLLLLFIQQQIAKGV
ncbi:unnamed protein product, partial [Sphagnum jensenii]